MHMLQKSYQPHERIVLLPIVLQPGSDCLALVVDHHLGFDHPALQLAVAEYIGSEHIPVDLDLDLLDIGLEGYALLHSLFQACCRPNTDRRSHELMVEGAELYPRLKGGYLSFRRRLITTGLII